MISLAHKLNKALFAVFIQSKEQLRVLFPRVSRGEMIMSFIIFGLIVLIAGIVINVIPQLGLSRIKF